MVDDTSKDYNISCADYENKGEIKYLTQNVIKTHSVILYKDGMKWAEMLSLLSSGAANKECQIFLSLNF